MRFIFIFLLVLLVVGCSDDNTINEEKLFKVEINNLNGELGTISGDSLYLDGTMCTLTAKSNIGNSFLGWYKDDQLVSNTVQYSFIPTSDITLDAKFIVNTPGEYVYYHNNSLRKIYYEAEYGVEKEISFTVVELNDVDAVPFVLYDASNTSTPIAYTKTSDSEFTYTIPAKNSPQTVIIAGAVPLFYFVVK